MSDTTKNIVHKYLKNDSRISYFRQSENVGGFKNMLFLMQNISTPYFMWFAHDDIMEPRFLETCIKALEKRADIDMAFTSIRNIDVNGRSIREYPYFYKLPLKSNLSGTPIPPVNFPKLDWFLSFLTFKLIAVSSLPSSIPVNMD